jgi:hypothetical protein
LVATVFGICELSSICATAVVTASNSHTSSYPIQLDIPICLLLTTIVGAITLTVAILFLRHPIIDTPIGGGDEAYGISRHRICKPAESPNTITRTAQTAVVGVLQFLVACVPQLPARVQPCVPLLTSIDALLPNSPNSTLPSPLSRPSLECRNSLHSTMIICPRSRMMMMMVTNRTAIDTFENTITPRQVTSLHHVRSYLTTRMYQVTTGLLSTRRSRTRPGRNIPTCTTPSFRGQSPTTTNR